MKKILEVLAIIIVATTTLYFLLVMMIPEKQDPFEYSGEPMMYVVSVMLDGKTYHEIGTCPEELLPKKLEYMGDLKYIREGTLTEDYQAICKNYVSGKIYRDIEEEEDYLYLWLCRINVEGNEHENYSIFTTDLLAYYADNQYTVGGTEIH